MKRTTPHQAIRSRIATAAVAAVTALAAGGASACAHSNPPEAAPVPTASAPVASARAPQTTNDIVRQTSFAPTLDVDLDKMLRHPSGLYVQNLTVGTGAVALRGKTLVVTYTGWLADGTKFDSGEITVTLGGKGVIPAWEEGLLGMRVGGKRRLIAPPALGYGASGAGKIPPNAVLVFDMELTAIV